MGFAFNRCPLRQLITPVGEILFPGRSFLNERPASGYSREVFIVLFWPQFLDGPQSPDTILGVRIEPHFSKHALAGRANAAIRTSAGNQRRRRRWNGT